MGRQDSTHPLIKARFVTITDHRFVAFLCQTKHPG